MKSLYSIVLSNTLWPTGSSQAAVMGYQREKLPRGPDKSNGVFLNCHWDCPKQISGKQSPLPVGVFKGKPLNCEISRRASPNICCKELFREVEMERE